ncbi:MAG: type II toxin-antitoxin system Phd/YefM family antitoxin [Sedimentisphaerales bacterium]|nr:type II toxin-antitoxin system Phd/YefM family antitoxin [Sedimentisphaerales bacterium]
MTTLTISNARQELPELVNKVAYGGERICLKRRNKPLAVLVSLDDLKLIEYLEDQLDIAAAHKALAKKSKTVTLEQLKERLGIK